MFLRELLCIQNKECLLPVLSDRSWAKWETDDETKQYQSITVCSLSLRLDTMEGFPEAHSFVGFCPGYGYVGHFVWFLEQNPKQRLPSPLSAINTMMVIF